MKKTLFILTAILSAVCIWAEELNYPKTIRDGKEYYIYNVQKSEGYYAISKRFNVTIKEIVDANGEGNLKLGQELYIPTHNEVTQATETPAVTEAPAVPDKKQGGYTIHTIVKGETLYSLSKRYGVTVDDIKALNPESDILSIGEELKIPAGGAETPATKPAGQSISDIAAASVTLIEPATNEITSDTVSVVTESVEADGPMFEQRSDNKVRIAVLMPFNTASFGDNDIKFVDFYRGCLIAADSLKALGYDVTIDPYDIGKTKESLYNVLQNKKLLEANLIIGPAYSAQVPFVADFAEKHNIKTIIPFANNVPQVVTNKNLFQVVCPQQELYPNVVKRCADEWADKHILIVKPDSAGIRYNKKEFSDMLATELAERNIEFKYIPAEHVALEVNSVTAKDSIQTVLVIPTTNHVQLTQISDHFDAIKTNRVSVFGFPEWNDMTHKDLYSKPLYMFSNHWLNFNDPETVKFYKNYYKKFGVPPMQNNPSYSIFGFDATLYFGKAWFGTEPESDMLQMNFKFEKVNGGGYANHGVYLHIYNNEGIH